MVYIARLFASSGSQPTAIPFLRRQPGGMPLSEVGLLASYLLLDSLYPRLLSSHTLLASPYFALMTWIWVDSCWG